VQAAAAAHDIVVVGMRQNPWTLPMVFVKGMLVGGAQDLKRLLESGELAAGKRKG
jgi:glutaredoxin-related protein